MADINVQIRGGVPVAVYKARYSKKYAKNEMVIQKLVEENHRKQRKAWLKQMKEENVRPF